MIRDRKTAVIRYHSVGVIRGGRVVARETLILPIYAKGRKGRVEILPEVGGPLKNLIAAG